MTKIIFYERKNSSFYTLLNQAYDIGLKHPLRGF